MIFSNREHAGEVLVEKLLKFKFDPKKSIIAAIPRGGIVVGVRIANLLKIPLFPLVIKKLGAPGNRELAIGATASFGAPVLDRWLIAELKVSGDYLKRETATRKKEALAREKFLGVDISKINVSGKVVIVVDDGIATGQTVKLAGKILRQLGAEKLILAVPCASPSALEAVKGEYDEIICPEISEDFMAVGQFYIDFRPIEDEEVKKILSKHLTINR